MAAAVDSASEPEPDGPPVNWTPEELGDPTVRLAPGDMTTSTFESAPMVWVPRRGVPEAAREAFERHFELVTWPERRVIQTRARWLDESSVPGLYSRLVLHPAEPLPDRWYAIRGRVPEGFAGSPGLPVDEDGRIVSRFRVGRQIVIERALVESFTGGGGAIAVLFSERVRPSASIRVTVNGAVASAVLVTTGARDDTSMMRWLVDAIEPGTLVAVSGFDRTMDSPGTRTVEDATGAAAEVVVQVPERRTAVATDDATSDDGVPDPGVAGDAPLVTFFVPEFGFRPDGI